MKKKKLLGVCARRVVNGKNNEKHKLYVIGMAVRVNDVLLKNSDCSYWKWHLRDEEDLKRKKYFYTPRWRFFFENFKVQRHKSTWERISCLTTREYTKNHLLLPCHMYLASSQHSKCQMRNVKIHFKRSLETLKVSASNLIGSRHAPVDWQGDSSAIRNLHDLYAEWWLKIKKLNCKRAS